MAFPHNTRTLVIQALEPSQSFKHVSSEHFHPYSAELERVGHACLQITSTIEGLSATHDPHVHEERCHTPSTCTTDITSFSGSEDSDLDTRPSSIASVAYQITPARKCLNHAINLIPIIEEEAWIYRLPLTEEVRALSGSTAQRRNQRYSKHLRMNTTPSNDEISAICALLALARDFLESNKHADLLSTADRETQLMALARNGYEDRIGLYVRDFVRRTYCVHPLEIKGFEAALHLGIKLRLIGALGQRYGLGTSLPLLFAFNLEEFSLLPYSALDDVQRTLASNRSVFNAIWNFADFTSAWWGRCQRDYEMDFLRTYCTSAGR